MDYFKRNNFDLIRLIAASQVMVFHGITHLDLPYSSVKMIINHFPGVPVFFFISGFLISASWERNSDLKTYAVNRFLRLYPAFVGVVLFSLISLFIFFEPATDRNNLLQLSFWLLTQLMILPWTPEFLEGYGTGSINGSLWTIPVEVTFYVLIPFIYMLIRKMNKPNVVLLTIVILSFSVQYLIYMLHPDTTTLVLASKILKATAIPWVGMFCFGILAQRNIERIYPIVAGKFFVFAIIFIILALISDYLPLYPLLKGYSNSMGIVNYLATCALVLSTAYSGRSISDKILKRNDISYGVYVFHMPVINIFVQNGIGGNTGFMMVLGLTIVLACLSWFLIEKPALGLKHWALYSHKGAKVKQ